MIEKIVPASGIAKAVTLDLEIPDPSKEKALEVINGANAITIRDNTESHRPHRP